MGLGTPPSLRRGGRSSFNVSTRAFGHGHMIFYI